MKRTRRYRPMIHALEDRVVLSFSFTHFIHSILPFVPDHSKAATAGSKSHAPGAYLAAHRSHPSLHAAGHGGLHANGRTGAVVHPHRALPTHPRGLLARNHTLAGRTFGPGVA